MSCWYNGSTPTCLVGRILFIFERIHNLYMPYKNAEKQKEVLHRYYVKNRNEYRLRKRKDVAEKRAYTSKLKDVPCMDCGKKYPHYVMDFDHINPEDKLTQVSKLVNLSWDRLRAEIDKCEVVCSNCHRIRTYNKRQRYLNNGESNSKL